MSCDFCGHVSETDVPAEELSIAESEAPTVQVHIPREDSAFASLVRKVLEDSLQTVPPPTSATIRDDSSPETSDDSSPSPSIYWPTVCKLETRGHISGLQAMQTRRVSSLKQCEGDDSQISEDAPSDFSRLARSKNLSLPQDASYSSARRARTLGERSIAKLTSGVSDGKPSSR